MREAPLPGALGSNGIRRRGRAPRPRMDKRERGHRTWGSRREARGGTMRFVGIDIAAERHVFAILGEDGAVLTRPMPFAEDVEGYASQLEALTGGTALVVMEATGHYWKNLFAVQVAADHQVALLNPLRGRRFQEQD